MRFPARTHAGPSERLERPSRGGLQPDDDKHDDYHDNHDNPDNNDDDRVNGADDDELVVGVLQAMMTKT